VSEWPEFRIVRAVFENTKQPWVDYFQLSTSTSVGRHLIESLVFSQRLKLAKRRERREEKCNQEGDRSEIGQSALPRNRLSLCSYKCCILTSPRRVDMTTGWGLAGDTNRGAVFKFRGVFTARGRAEAKAQRCASAIKATLRRMSGSGAEAMRIDSRASGRRECSVFGVKFGIFARRALDTNSESTKRKTRGDNTGNLDECDFIYY